MAEPDEEEWSKELEENRKPGQKHPTPAPAYADRVFYESLLRQRPESTMARKWCIEYGILKWSEAEALCKELGIPITVTKPATGDKTKVKGGKKGKIQSEAADAEAMELDGGNSHEGVGVGAL